MRVSVEKTKNSIVSDLLKALLTSTVLILAGCKTDISPEWETLFSHAQEDESRVEWLADVEVDSYGDVISGGSTVIMGADRRQDLSLVKQDKDGYIIWETQYDFAQGAYRSDDKITNIAIDEEDNIYTIGVQYIVEDDAQRYGSFLAKFDSYGELVWSKALSDAEDAREIVIKLDRIYVTGHALQVFNSQGDLKIYQEQDKAWDIQVDELGNIYTVGATKVYKYDESGALLWSTDLPDNLYPQASLALNYDGSIVVAHNQDNRVAHITGIDSNGNITWIRTYQPATQSYGLPGPALVNIDDRGDIILSLSNDKGRRLVKLDDLGREIWQVASQGIAQDVAINDFGDIFVVGGGVNEKYGSDGQFLASTVATKGTQITTGAIALDGDAMYIGYSAVEAGDIQLYLAKFFDK